MFARMFLENAVHNVKNLYETTGEINHTGEKGSFREMFLAEIIEPFLPHHYGIGSGVIVDYEGRQSSQTDVIIYDKRLMPAIFAKKGNGIYPIDSVICVVEVKSTLNTSEIKKIIPSAYKLSPKNPEGLKMTERNSGATYPLYAVFAYTSDAKDKDERARFRECCPAKITAGGDLVRLITILDKGTWRITKSDRINGAIYENASIFLMSLLDAAENMSSSRNKHQLSDWL